MMRPEGGKPVSGNHTKRSSRFEKEKSFHPRAKNTLNTTHRWGLCKLNEYYYFTIKLIILKPKQWH